MVRLLRASSYRLFWMAKIPKLEPCQSRECDVTQLKILAKLLRLVFLGSLAKEVPTFFYFLKCGLVLQCNLHKPCVTLLASLSIGTIYWYRFENLTKVTPEFSYSGLSFEAKIN